MFHPRLKLHLLCFRNLIKQDFAKRIGSIKGKMTNSQQVIAVLNNFRNPENIGNE